MKVRLKEFLAALHSFIGQTTRRSASGMLLCRQCGTETRYQQRTLPMEFPSVRESGKTEPMTFTVNRIPYCPRCTPENSGLPPLRNIEAVVVGQ